MDYDTLMISGHAFRRMFERNITEDDVENVIRNVEVIETYLGDTPHPSWLILGSTRQGPLHVVVAKDERRKTCHVITTYVPDPEAWALDFRTRKKT